MRRTTSMGPGGGSGYSPPRLPPVCDVRSHAVEREACQSENFTLFRCPGGMLPVIYMWQRMTQAIVLCFSRALSWSRGAVEAVVGPEYVAWKACGNRSLACRLPREMVRAGRGNELYGRPVAVPVFSRRYAGPPSEFGKQSPGNQRRMEAPAMEPAAAPCVPMNLSSSSVAIRHQISQESREWRDSGGGTATMISDNHASAKG